jgi:predicted anti-sigma-YlaC factor YlaD
MNTPCHEIKGLLDDYFDGALSRKDKKRLQAHLQLCEACRLEFQKEKHMIENLEGMPTFQCPEKVVQRIAELTYLREEKSPRMKIREFLSKSKGWRLAVVGTAAMALMILIVWYAFKEPEEPIQATYSEADLLKAREQAKWSLVYVTQMIQKSEKEVVDEIFMKELPETVRNALKNTIPIFRGG